MAAGSAENARLTVASSASDVATARSRRSPVRRKRPYMRWAASSDMRAPAVSMAACSDVLPYVSSPTEDSAATRV